LLRVYLKEPTTGVTDAMVGRPCRRNYGSGSPSAVRHSHSSAQLAGAAPKFLQNAKFRKIWGRAVGVVAGSLCGGKMLKVGDVIKMTPVIIDREFEVYEFFHF